MVALAGPDASAPAERPRRADARRNYEQVVAQARLVFAESGVDASLDDIARRAGVASGTLYRHFPTRQRLFEAVLADQVAQLVELGRELLMTEDEARGLTAWLRAALTHALTYRGLAAAVMNSALDDENSTAAALHARLFETGALLLARARRAGSVRDDVDAADVLKLLGAMAWASQDATDPQAQADRLLNLVLNGLGHSSSWSG